MKARNEIIEGSYKGFKVINVLGSVQVSNLTFKDKKTIHIDRNSVLDYILIDESFEKSYGRIAYRGTIGAALLGPAGLIEGILTAKDKGIVHLILRFYDGKQSLIEIDDKTFKSIQILLKPKKENTVKIDIENISISQMEEIKKLKELLDINVISNQEFDNSKNEILGIGNSSKLLIKNLVVNDFAKFLGFFSKDKLNFLKSTKLCTESQLLLNKSELPCVAVKNLTDSEIDYFSDLLNKNNVSFEIVDELIEFEEKI